IAEKLIKPILQSFEPVQPGIENIKLSYPTLLTLVIVFISLLFSNIVTLSELNSKAYLRNLIAPVNDLIYVIGLIFTNLLVILFQVIILLMVAQFRFGIDVFSNFWSIMFIVFLLSLIFVFFGMAIAYYFSNEQSSILTATFVSLAFFLFSDIVTPLEAMPKHATLIANNSPFVISQAIFKKIIIYDLPLYMSMSSIYKLIIYALLSLVLLIIVSKWKNRTRI
ncbi:ABC transporter permease, partial [archaeon]|nr:ABC transporter permease [archaeon]